MAYYSQYFEGIALSILAAEEVKKVNDTGAGMGLAISYCKASLAAFERAKPIVGTIGGPYLDTFNTKVAEVNKLFAKADSENKSIYFDKELPLD
jgi:hypothetical protein